MKLYSLTLSLGKIIGKYIGARRFKIWGTLNLCAGGLVILIS